jgi:Protein of unknown function (DUF3099)
VRIGHHGGQEPVYGITTAEQSHTDEITRRQKQYILTMLIRVVSIVVVVAVPGISWPIKILLILLATVIPYIAVVRANGGPAPEKDPTNLLLAPPDKPALEHDQLGLPGTGPVVSGDPVFDDAVSGDTVSGDAVSEDAVSGDAVSGEADEATGAAGADGASERGKTAPYGETARGGEADDHRIHATAPPRADTAARPG